MKLSEIFSTEYLSMMEKHRNRIQEIINSYDVVIFMARKAICLYKALVANMEIQVNPNCTVLSSRAITFNCYDLLKEKSIAVVDDVVVLGKSIKSVMDTLKSLSLSADVYIMAEEIGNNEDIGLGKYIINPSQKLEPTNIDRFSSQITLYIHLSGISYNIDHPIYRFTFDSEEDCKMFLAENNCSNLTDGIMRKHGLERYTLHYPSTCLKIPSANDSLIKIRFIHKTNSVHLLAVPLVLLPEMHETVIGNLFDKYGGEEFKQLVANNIKQFEIENKYKVLQYIMAEGLMTNFITSQGIQNAKKDLCNEKIVFSKTIGNTSSENIANSFILTRPVFAYSENSELQEGVARFYDNLFGKKTHTFYDCFGKEIVGKTITRNDVEKDNDNLIASCVLDIMVDKGILVPSIVHTNNKTIIRAYRLGEIFKLHGKGVRLFHYMVYSYSQLRNRALYRTEFEKLCVLFLKQTAYSKGDGLFDPVDSFEDDCFSIGYSKFGPRVSNIANRYSVYHQSALSELMLDQNMIAKTNQGRYDIKPANPPAAIDWTAIATSFAMLYANADKAFVKITPDPKVNSYIDFLTLLAIGSEKRNKLYSLIAELHLFVKRINIGETIRETLDSIDHIEWSADPSKSPIYKGVMDGIDSGIWKYRCYQDEDLVKRTNDSLSQVNPSLANIYVNYLKIVASQDQNKVYDTFIDECGQLLCNIGSIVNGAYIEAYGKPCPRLTQKLDEVNNIELYNFQELKEKAEFLIDRCDLCIENDAVTYGNLGTDITVIYDPDRIIKRVKRKVFKGYKTQVLLDCFIPDTSDQYDHISGISVIKAKVDEEYLGLAVSGYYVAGRNFTKLILWAIQNLGDTKTDKLAIIGAEKNEEGYIRVEAYGSKKMYVYNKSADKNVEPKSSNPIIYNNITINGNVDNSQLQAGTTDSNQTQQSSQTDI